MSTFTRVSAGGLATLAITISVGQALAFAHDYTEDWRELPPPVPFATNATAVGTASLSTSTYTSHSMPETVLEDREYVGRLERFAGITTTYRSRTL